MCRHRAAFSPDKDLISDAFHLEAVEGVQRRRAQRLTAARGKTRVMPRTAQGVPHREPLLQRRPIVRAASANGQDFLAVAQKEHGRALEMALNRDSIPKLVDWDSGGKVWTFERGWLGHERLRPVG